MGDGKTNPFGDGKSGASGNSGGGAMPGLVKGHMGPNRSQKMGCSNDGQFDGDQPEKGDKYLKIDPPDDRKGLVDQTAKGMKKKPFSLGGKGPSMPSSNASIADAATPVGDVRNEPDADQDF
jgi:hypothetical protein